MTERGGEDIAMVQIVVVFLICQFFYFMNSFMIVIDVCGGDLCGGRL